MTTNRPGSRSRTLAVVSLLAVAAASLDACTSEAPKAHDARAVVVATTSPGSAWTSGGRGLDTGLDQGQWHRNGTIWRTRLGDAARNGFAYLTTWQTTVQPGQRRARCTEAALWLTQVGAKLPGKVVQGFENDPHPTQASVVTHCVSALGEGEGGPDEAYTDTFASWPNTTTGGYQFGPYLQAVGSGATDRWLTASVMASRG